MNDKRRSNLRRVLSLLHSAYDLTEIARDDEQNCFDNLPEQFQESDRGVSMEETISGLDEALDAIESAVRSIEEVI